VSEIQFPLKMDVIQSVLPHRFPFLLVDRVLDIQFPKKEPGKLSPQDMEGIRVKALKNVSINEPYLAGHFPNFPIVPGVLLLESMAQVGIFSIYPYVCHELDRFSKTVSVVLMGANEVKFRKPVVPGDRAEIETVVTRCRGKIWTFRGMVTVEGQKVMEAEILARMESGVDIF